MREIENALAWLEHEDLTQIENRWWKLEASHLSYPLFVDRDALEELNDGLAQLEDEEPAQDVYVRWLGTLESTCDREYRDLYL